jgi:hypothetical protein
LLIGCLFERRRENFARRARHGFEGANLAEKRLQDHVAAPEMLMGLIDSLENRTAVSDIERQCQHGIAVGDNENVQRLRITRGRGRLVAALKGGLRPAKAKSA